ncbi:MAG: PEPxxWA-CTERM sorting domain-containing protein [Azonexus sp.]|nr:PEPxxWA-CTERM sorting domain-containing protein [Azonexus sp.]
MVSLTQTPITTNVPEPTTWAMLLAGMGVVGAITRRRRMWA